MKVISYAPLLVLLGVFAFFLLGYLLFSTLGVSFTKNISPSAPLGLYALISPLKLNRGDYVTMKIPSRISSFAGKTPWLSEKRPLLKTVAALSSDTVCLKKRSLTINGVEVARTRPRDRQGKRLPHWMGCKTLNKREFLALNTFSDRSFDGRYFGPTKLGVIKHKAIPVITFLETNS